VLGLAVGVPVMQVNRAALTFGDRPVEHRVSIINTAHHDYVNLLSRPAGQA
jgi:GntR family transcriptional regulator